MNADKQSQLPQVKSEAIDKNILFRYLHLHCFIHMHRVLSSVSADRLFSPPRFQLFKRIERLYHKKDKDHLFKNLLFTYLIEVLLGIFITIIYASLNLLVPELIRQFMHFMREKHSQQESIKNFIGKFILIQILRIFFAEHTKRLFYELAIKVQSTLARKLVSKSLRMAKQCRDRIAQSQIIQLQNVDLKLIFTLFKNLYVVIEAPFTIIVAIIVLFNEAPHYGFIGVYWFLIAFLLQRELDGKMTKCNEKKLGLIQKRSNLNYELFDKMKSARLIGYENIIIEKNNDLFIEENHDHCQYYSYCTLYDITLLMLPIFVVATITLFDYNEEDPITVEQVYLMLSLLGICYNPMKSFRLLTLYLHDGLHSLKRLSTYYHLPEDSKSTMIEATGETGALKIYERTVATYPHSAYDFQIKISFYISIEKGERLILIGKKNSGCSSFLEMIVGNMKKVSGKIQINGKISYLSEHLFFLKDNIRENIRFLNNEILNFAIQNIYKELKLDQDLKFLEEMDTIMDDENKFNVTVLKKIALARLLTSEADYYILDCPYTDLEVEIKQVVEGKLRELQWEGKTIIMSVRSLVYIEGSDYLAILNDGSIEEFGRFTDLINSVQSHVKYFFKSKEDHDDFAEPLTKQVENRFNQRVLSVKHQNLVPLLSPMIRGRNYLHLPPQTPRIPRKLPQNLPQLKKLSTSYKLFMPLAKKGFKLRDEQRRQKIPQNQFQEFLLKFLGCISLKDIFYMALIILSAEVLHIFIHFYIGHMEQQYGTDDYAKYKSMMIAEVALTFCLAGVTYIQGEISTIIAVILGNKLYSSSLKEVTNKRLSWLANQYSVKMADKYNHDYEEIFIACHSIISIYKNLVILIATIEFISTNRSKLVAILILLAAIYYSIFYVFRKIERKIVRHYYDYKYSYVRVLQESIKGAEMFKTWGLKQEILKRAENKYLNLASYKLAQSYTSYGLSLICDFFSLTLLAIGIEYGIELKMHGREQKIAIVATSIFLLMNISEVLKTIIREMMLFQTFFCINLVRIPFMEIAAKDQRIKSISDLPMSTPLSSENEIKNENDVVLPKKAQSFYQNYKVQFINVLLEEPNEVLKQNNLFSLTINEGEIILLYEVKTRYRDLLLYALTKNLPMFNEPQEYGTKFRTIKIGGVDLRSIPKQKIQNLVGVLLLNNFYLTGTIRENISWNCKHFNEEQANRYAQILKFRKNFSLESGQSFLSVKISSESKKINSDVLKKIAVLRLLVRKPKIIIIKDTDEFCDGVDLIELLIQQIENVTLIKISNQLQSSIDVQRIVYMKNMHILEEGSPEELMQKKESVIGKQLRDINVRSYKFMKRVSVGPRLKK